MLKSFFHKNQLLFAKKWFFSLLSFLTSQWPLVTWTCWAAVRADAAVEVGAGEAGYKQTGHADWTDRLPHALARSVTCHGNIQSAAESGGGRETAACSKQHRLKRYLLDGGGGRGENPCPVSKRSAITPTPVGLLGKPVGGQAARLPLTTQGADREVSIEVRGFTLIISKASNRSALTAASARVPISRIDNRDTRMRTRICFDNRFFDYRLTCLVTDLLVILMYHSRFLYSSQKLCFSRNRRRQK